MKALLACRLASALILGASPVVAQAQAVGAAAPLLVDGTFEMIGWSPDSPHEKFRDLCAIVGTSVSCHMKEDLPFGQISSTITGTLRGNQMVSQARIHATQSDAGCSITMDTPVSGTIKLAQDGTFSVVWSSAIVTITSATGSCAGKMPRTLPPGPPSTWTGTWRQLTTSAVPAVAVAPGAGDAKVSVRIEGNTIYVTDESGQARVVTLLSPTKMAPPAFSPPTVGGEAKAFEKYVMTHWYEASYGHLPPELRSTFVSGMRMPSDVAGEAAQAVLDAGESAANWVRNNPAEVGLLVLSTAVSLAFPVSAFASPTVAVGGAAILRGVVGSAMVAGTTGFVQKLMGNVFTDQTATQRFREAAAKGAGDAAASVPGSLAGAGFEKVAGQIAAKTAVTAGSVAVGIATDKAMEKLQVSEKTAALVLKAPSYASSLLALPNPSYEPGGISLNFDR